MRGTHDQGPHRSLPSHRTKLRRDRAPLWPHRAHQNHAARQRQIKPGTHRCSGSNAGFVADRAHATHGGRGTTTAERLVDSPDGLRRARRFLVRLRHRGRVWSRSVRPERFRLERCEDPGRGQRHGALRRRRQRARGRAPADARPQARHHGRVVLLLSWLIDGRGRARLRRISGGPRRAGPRRRAVVDGDPRLRRGVAGRTPRAPGVVLQTVHRARPGGGVRRQHRVRDALGPSRAGA